MFFQFLVSDYEIMNIKKSDPNKKSFIDVIITKIKRKLRLAIN